MMKCKKKKKIQKEERKSGLNTAKVMKVKICYSSVMMMYDMLSNCDSLNSHTDDIKHFCSLDGLFYALLRPLLE